MRRTLMAVAVTGAIVIGGGLVLTAAVLLGLIGAAVGDGR